MKRLFFIFYVPLWLTPRLLRGIHSHGRAQIVVIFMLQYHLLIKPKVTSILKPKCRSMASATVGTLRYHSIFQALPNNWQIIRSCLLNNHSSKFSLAHIIPSNAASWVDGMFPFRFINRRDPSPNTTSSFIKSNYNQKPKFLSKPTHQTRNISWNKYFSNNPKHTFWQYYLG